MSSHKSTTKSSSSGSSMSLILGFSKSMEKGNYNFSKENKKNRSFGVLYAMIKGNTFPRILTIISLLIEFCQLSSFGFKQQYPWGGDAGYYLKRIMSPVSHPSNLVGYNGFTIFFWIVIGLLLLGFFNIWYVAYQFYRGKIANIWIIRTLRWFVSTTVAVLFIPIISLLLIGLDCDYSQGGILKTFSNDNIYCFKGANLSIAIVSIILIIVFSIVGFTSSATYYEYDTNVKSRFSKPHARFDVYILFVKLILALLNSLVDFSPWTTSIVYFILSITLVFGSIIILPYNNQRLNQVKSGFYTTVFWVSFMTLVTMGINDETTATTCYITIVGAFFAFPIGYFSNRFYYNWLSSKIDQLKLPTSSSTNDFNEITKNEKSKTGDSKEKESSSPSKVTWGKQPITLGSKRQIIFPFFQNKFVMSFFVEIMVRKLLRSSNGSNGDDGISSNSNESIEHANNLYQCGLQYFPNSDLLWMAYCNFLFTVRKDRHIGYAALEKLRRMKPSFDVRFFIYQRDKEREQIMDSDLRGPEHTGKIQDFVSYMEFKKLYYGAKRHHVKCLTYIKKFWGLLLHETVDLHRLSDLSGRIATTENKANESYERLLALNPNSVRVLRDYSQFLEEVVKDTESSYKLQKKAEAIEDIMSKSQTTDFKTIDIKNLDNSDTELDQVLKQESNAIQLAKIDADIERSGSKSGSSKSKDDSSESSSSSKGRRGKYKEFQQSNAINKLSWLMIGTTACCIIFLIVMLIVLRDLSVKHTHSYQGIISITDCASEAVSIAINLNTMQAISISAGSVAFPFEAAEAMITQYRKQNDRSLIIMKNIHDAIYWGEGDPTSYVGDNLSKLKSINGFDVFDIGSTIFSFEEFNRSSTLVDNKEMIDIYSTPSVNMTILVSPPGTNSTNYITVTQTYNAWKAGNSFYESALIANKMSVQDIKDRAVFDPDFKFIILNAPSNIPEMYMKIQQVYIKSLIDDINTTLDTMLYVWVAIFCFLIILGAVLFRPIVTKISREKIRTLVLFSLAPKDVVFKLSSKKIKMTSLDSGSERDNLFDTTDDDAADGIDNHEHLQVDERKKNDDIIDDGSIVNRSINFGSHRRPLMNSTNVLASTTTINRGTISNRLNEDHDKVPLIENSISNNNKGYGWDGKSKRNLNKKSLRSVLRRLHWSYVLAIFLLFGFITMGLWVTYSVVHDNTQSGYVLGKSCSRSLDSRIINYYIAELYTFDNDANENEALEAVLQLQSNHQSLPYLEDVRPLMEGSYGCWMLNKSNCITSDSIYYNDVSIGLDWLVDQYTKHSVSLVNTDPSLLSTSPELGWMQAIGSDVVFQGLDTATFTYFQYYLSQKDWATKVLTSVLAISCVLLLVIHLLLFRPFMNHLRIQHIHTLALLRLAPDDIRFMEVSDKVIDED
ncbi:HAT repeat-containing protein [Dictyostelium discoideum AX4]|uniref:Tiny macrocysts protein C n=1 Tax=Dictyostelium discoideum TaxID=44689 RepID=TMCC_DICDI|nr:HAT repeat-containing protein [Dictyostelium discoideum AX4]Q5FBC4.1 RecName: Full=Tiny macrocysts protein C; AltName: Full=Gamete enriched gene 10 protein; AltName: Full=HAT repeat-containing protein tmcC [Dictyostelium discoideum]EAL62814.1 HAT repeat-containing protein [Dictyostelium discoideum AX4]BAD89538.1 TmcC [Dictyostelium discoideum]|eukprot:XP_636256.1 HAT repeat-containing protein [Dictyostelium discoideum AX4]